MAYALLILGLIAAGIYTENVAFYVFAAIAGFCWFIIVITVAALTASVKKGIDSGDFKITRSPAQIRGRRRY